MRKVHLNLIKILLLITLIIISTSIVPHSYADSINVGDTIYLSQVVSGFNGGPFGVKTSLSGDILFYTFCLETDEYFYPNQPYTVYNISDTAIAGGSNTNSGDPLDPRTAYLYTMYRLNMLPSYFNPANNDHLISLQRAIWLIEGEISSTNDDMANTLLALANNSGWTTIGDVRVINLGAGGGNQDQLVLVPEPATVLLLGIGLVGMAILMRRRKRTA